MYTSYDDVWQCFINNCKTSGIDLPKTDEAIYQAIKNAVMYYNNRLRLQLQCNDAEEKFNEVLDGDHLLILANFLRLIFLINEKTYFQSLWQPFQKDVGIKNYKPQVDAIDKSIENQNHTLDMLIRNTEEDFI